MSDRRPASGTTLHLVPEPYWTAHAELAAYAPEAFAEEGFIHTTHGEDVVIEIANMFYAGDPRPYLLLTIDLGAVSAETVYEDPDNRFPHIYGHLPTASVMAIRRVLRDQTGRFTGIGETL